MEHISIIKDAFDIYGTQYRSLGDYSATTLISPPRQVALMKRYGHLVRPTVNSQAASLIGTAVHEKMESLLNLANAKHVDYMLERGMVHPFPAKEADGVDHFRLVSGRFDILHKEQDLYDIKTAKTWKLVFDPEMIDWHEQQNIYAYLLRMRGIEVKTLNICAFYLDWIESQSLRSSSYPQAPIVQYRLALWTTQEQEDFIQKRLALHVAAEETPDEDLPVCTQEERWEQDPVFAIMKNSEAKRAAKLVKEGTFSDAVEVARGMGGLGADSYIEVRYQRRKRCMKYCNINEYCDVHQTYLETTHHDGDVEAIPLASVL